MRSFGRLLTLSRNIFSFSTNKEHLMTLTRELITNYKTFKPWKNIRLVHQVTFAPFDPDYQPLEKTSIEKEDDAKIHTIINEMSGQLHHVPHEQINMLLEVLKNKGYLFTNDLPIFRALNKTSKMLFGKHLKQNLLWKTLFHLRVLHFPKITTIKILQDFQRLLISQKDNNKVDSGKITLTNLIKLTLFCLQQPYVTFPIVKKYMDHILKQSASNLSSLCALYHLSSILSKAIQTKIQYQLTRTHVRDIIFNPYNSHQEQNGSQSKQKQESKEEYDHKQQIRKKLIEVSNEIIKMFTEAVDIKKLEKSIVSSIKSDIEPITKEEMIYVSDILELQPYVENYLQQNIERLTPVELIYFTKRCKDVAGPIINAYLEKLGKYMSVQEKAYILIEANQLFHRQIKSEVILDIIKEAEIIDYSSFMAIVKMTEVLSGKDIQKAKQILEAVKIKMEKES